MTTSSSLGLLFRIWDDVTVFMKDGVLLSADICLPVMEGPFPTLLLRTPYNNQAERYVREYVPRFVQNGYAVVMQDCRGRHDSDGEWYPYVNEPKDGYDTQHRFHPGHICSPLQPLRKGPSPLRCPAR